MSYIYTYQIEDLRETSWHILISSLDDDQGERNGQRKPLVCRAIFSDEFFGEPAMTKAWIVTAIFWGVWNCLKLLGKWPISGQIDGEDIRVLWLTREAHSADDNDGDSASSVSGPPKLHPSARACFRVVGGGDPLRPWSTLRKREKSSWASWGKTS